MALALAPNFGYVALCAAATAFVHNGWMFGQVMQARKKYKVQYPALYATAENSPKATAEDRDKFNCVQRAHQNSLENLPTFYALLLTAGLKFPTTAAAAGAVYLLGRIFYFQGYSTGNPQKRLRGGFLYLGTFTLMGAAVKMAWELLRNQ